MRSTLTVAFLAGLLVLAGCSAPTAPPESPTAGPSKTDAAVPTSTTPPQGATTATDTVTTATTRTTATTTPTQTATTATPGEYDPAPDGQMAAVYGIDADRTTDRVERLLGVSIRHPEVVVSGERINATESEYGGSLARDRFLAAFDLAAEGDGNGTFQIAGYVESARTVVMSPDLATGQAESTLAHELVHVVQQQKRWRPAWNGTTLYGYWGTRGREVRHVQRLLTEGTAQYLGYAYGARYLDAPSVDRRLTVLERRYEDLTGAKRLGWAPYYYGLTYIDERIDNTTGIGDIYDGTPMTTEQVLHDETPATEPPAPLSVVVDAPDYRLRGPQGELLTRIALRQELPDDTADGAAAGWGNDRLIRVETGNATGHVWVTRWDTPADATEFAEAVETFAALQIDSTLTYDVRRPAGDVVVVALGPSTVVDRTSVTAQKSVVRVTVAPNATG